MIFILVSETLRRQNSKRFLVDQIGSSFIAFGICRHFALNRMSLRTRPYGHLIIINNNSSHSRYPSDCGHIVKYDGMCFGRFRCSCSAAVLDVCSSMSRSIAHSVNHRSCIAYYRYLNTIFSFRLGRYCSTCIRDKVGLGRPVIFVLGLSC